MQDMCRCTYMRVFSNGGTQQSRVFLLKRIILGCFGGNTFLLDSSTSPSKQFLCSYLYPHLPHQPTTTFPPTNPSKTVPTFPTLPNIDRTRSTFTRCFGIPKASEIPRTNFNLKTSWQIRFGELTDTERQRNSSSGILFCWVFPKIGEPWNAWFMSLWWKTLLTFIKSGGSPIFGTLKQIYWRKDTEAYSLYIHDMFIHV